MTSDDGDEGRATRRRWDWLTCHGGGVSWGPVAQPEGPRARADGRGSIPRAAPPATRGSATGPRIGQGRSRCGAWGQVSSSVSSGVVSEFLGTTSSRRSRRHEGRTAMHAAGHLEHDSSCHLDDRAEQTAGDITRAPGLSRSVTGCAGPSGAGRARSGGTRRTRSAAAKSNTMPSTSSASSARRTSGTGESRRPESETSSASKSEGGPRASRRCGQPEVLPGGRRGHPAARGAGEQPGTDQERLGDLLDRLALLTDRHGERGTPTGPPPKRRHRASSTARSSRSRPRSSTS